MYALKPYILLVTLALIVGAIYFLNTKSLRRTDPSEPVPVIPRISSKNDEAAQEKKAGRYALASEITTPDGFINTDGKPLTINGLIGKKVILVDFWTYSCINCQRTTPYLNTWYEKYKDKGFVIIGVHTPEFEFEKDYDNVKTAVEKFGIKFPVVLDNDYSTWTAYKNQYWPRKYLIDIDGYVVYNHIGEGQYEETEQKIQEALAERMALLGDDGGINVPLTKETLLKNGARSPETYFGAFRNQSFANGVTGVLGEQKALVLPARISPHTLYLSGDWSIAHEFASNTSPGARILYTYVAQDVFLVAHADSEIVVEVLRDGKPLVSEAGADIIETPDGKTVVKIKGARLYKIIQGTQSGTHALELLIPQPGLKAFTFTFG